METAAPTSLSVRDVADVELISTTTRGGDAPSSSATAAAAAATAAAACTAAGEGAARGAICMRLQLAHEPLMVWARLAVSVHNLVWGVRETRELPRLLGLPKPTVGRHKTRSIIPLPDIKAKKRHAKLHLEPAITGDARRRLPAGALELVPHNGKPVLALLGRADFRHKAPWPLSAGDVFGVGRSLVRVLFVGRRAAGAPRAAVGRGDADGCTVSVVDVAGGGSIEVHEDDATKYQRATAKGHKRAAKVAAQAAAEARAALGETQAAAAEKAAAAAAAAARDASAEAAEEGDEDEEDEDEESEEAMDDEGSGRYNMFERRAFAAESAGRRAAIRAPFIHLAFIAGPYRKREEVIDAPCGLIGASSEGCDVALPTDTTVSPLHARLTFHDNTWWLSDAGSATGTHLLIEDRGRRVACGDVFRIARSEIQISAVPEPWATM